MGITIRKERVIIAFLLALALLLRVWDLGGFGTKIDLRSHALTAYNYASKGQMSPDRWAHPPLKHLTLYWSIKIFGADAFGERMRNVLFGTVSVGLLYFLGREIFKGDKRTAFLAGVLLALDPLHILISRSTFEEVQVNVFSILAVYYVVRFLRGHENSSIWAGLFLGLSLATKWYILPASAVFFAAAIYARPPEERIWTRGSLAVSSFVVLPFAVYLLAFIPWFGRGYDMFDFFRMQMEAYRDLSTSVWDASDPLAMSMTSALEWFTGPCMHIFMSSAPEGGWGRYGSMVSNFPFMVLAGPACAYAAYSGWRNSNVPLLTVLAVFLSMYMPLLVLKRLVFLYSAVALLPFVYLLVAYLLVRAIGLSTWSGTLYYAMVALSVMWGMYLYPFVTSQQVPVALYKPLLWLARSQGLELE